MEHRRTRPASRLPRPTLSPGSLRRVIGLRCLYGKRPLMNVICTPDTASVTTGAYTDPNVTIDLENGSPRSAGDGSWAAAISGSTGATQSNWQTTETSQAISWSKSFRTSIRSCGQRAAGRSTITTMPTKTSSPKRGNTLPCAKTWPAISMTKPCRRRPTKQPISAPCAGRSSVPWSLPISFATTQKQLCR